MDAIRTSCYRRGKDSIAAAEGHKQWGLWSKVKPKLFVFPWAQNCFWLPQMNTFFSAAQHLMLRLGWGAIRWWNKKSFQDVLWNLNGFLNTLAVGDAQLQRISTPPFQRAILKVRCFPEEPLEQMQNHVSLVSYLAGRSARAARALRHQTKASSASQASAGAHQQSWGFVPSCHQDSSSPPPVIGFSAATSAQFFA